MGKAVAKQQNLRSKASMNSVTKIENRIISNSLAPSCVEHHSAMTNMIYRLFSQRSGGGR